MKNRFLSTFIISALVGISFLSNCYAQEQKQSFFRIMTGGTTGTYFPIGGLIANAISNPAGSRPCEQGGSCGVPGLIAIAQSSNGSVANVNAIQAGTAESGFVQSDVAAWAFTATGSFAGKPKMDKLRLITNLYPESLHIVARKGAGIKSVKDLKGKRVSLDEPGSGTLEDAKLILGAFGLTEKDLKADYLKPGSAADKIKDNQLDAFFFVAGYPTGSITELAASNGIELVRIEGAEVAKLVKDYPFFSQTVIPGKTYQGVDQDTPTISVGAQWVVSADVSEEQVYNITKALWNDNTRKLLDSGHAKGKAITLANALESAGIPLHPGADKFYKEKGMMKK